jgi:hypothetical protein
MLRFLVFVLTLFTISCRPLPPELDSPPSVEGVLPGQTVWQAVDALGPLKWTPELDSEGQRGFEFSSGHLVSRAGLIDKITTNSLTVGNKRIESGNSLSEVESVWGPAESRFRRDGRDLSLYVFQKYRYELEWNSTTLKTLEITREPTHLTPLNPPYGKGVLGDDLRTEPGLSLDGVSLGWSRSRAEKSLGESHDRFWGASGAYGPDSNTVVGYADSRVHWVLGNQLKQEEKVWVETGMSVGDAAKNLAKVARVKQYSSTWMTYTFLNVGDVTMATQNDKVIGIEMYNPREESKK